MSRRPAERRTQHAVMATASEWARIRELAAAAAGMDFSRYIVHRATVPDPLPDTVLRRAVRELLLLARIEEQREFAADRKATRAPSALDHSGLRPTCRCAPCRGDGEGRSHNCGGDAVRYSS